MELSNNLLKGLSKKLSLLFAFLDALSVLLSGLATYYLRFHDLQLSYNYVFVLAIAVLANYLVFSLLNIYRLSTRASFSRHFSQLARGWIITLLLLVSLAFIFKSSTVYSRVWFGLWMLLDFMLLILNRYILFSLFDFMRARGLNQRRVAVIGCNAVSQTLMKRLDKIVWTGYTVTHLWRSSTHEQAESLSPGMSVTDIPDQVQAFVQKNQIDEIWFVLSLKEIDTIRTLLCRLRELAIPIRMMLNADEFAFFEYTITDIAGFPALNLNASPMEGMNRFLKGVEDRLLACAILFLITPLLMAIACGVKLTSKGPVFFRQKRLGWDGKIIKVYKFRTMYEHQEQGGVVTQARLSDERVTPFGKWLRKTSLDELPQFINVLQGRMSIVGPRPHALSHNDEYKTVIHAYMQRHRVKPGITGWAQVNGWRGETDTLQKMEKRVECDLYYINNWSLRFDLKIILLTLFKGFIHQNAY